MGVTNDILDRNLLVLASRNPELAARIRSSAGREDLEFIETPEGLSAVLGGAKALDAFEIGGVSVSLAGVGGVGGSGVQLASRRRPASEGRTLAESVDLSKHAAVVAMGFALGHHVRALVERVKRDGIVFVFEPDVALLRSVLERADCSGWIGSPTLRILTDAEDTAAISAAVSGAETLVSLGTTILHHPASRARLGAASEAFGRSFAHVMKAVRTTVLTTLVQVESTLRNLLQNIDHYATCEGIKELKDLARGRAAVVVSAGPSLERNIELLCRPGVRDRVVIIAVQTVLKTLLARGVRPHFVTALDYHEISRRFYEGLTAGDVEGVTLVVEAKANPAILESFPGRIRCVGDAVLDGVLGEELARDLGEIQPGATVAHLAYYLARHLGCDPVILVGQDLGFTDGQYYAGGAAIHRVWGSELGEFRTLEMFEWERIVRMRALLRRTTDQLGRPVYTDEQMSTYLVQFERDFAADSERGRSVIDASEGGVRKRHTRAMTLEQALSSFGSGTAWGEPGRPEERGRAARLERVRERVRRVRREVWELSEMSRQTAALLGEMRENQGDQARVNALIGEVYRLRDRVKELTTAYWLVEFLNQTGAFKRFRADRELRLDESVRGVERQKREIDRDIQNVSWVGDAADAAGRLLDDAIRSLHGQPKVTRDLTESSGGSAEVSGGTDSGGTLAVVMVVDPGVSALGCPRDLGAAFLLGKSTLDLTLERLTRCRSVKRVVMLTAHPEALRRLTARAPAGLTIDVVGCEVGVLEEHRRRVGSGRLWSRTSWRGGLGNLSCYDEVLCPAAAAPVMARLGIDAAVVVGADWALVDPELIDKTVARYRELAARSQLVFSQAPPGLGACVVGRGLVEEMAAHPGVFASIGALLGYIPAAPQADPIAKPACVGVEAVVRDCPVRLIVDSAAAGREIARALRAVGPAAACGMNAAELATALGDPASLAGELPRLLTLDLSGEDHGLASQIVELAARQIGERADAGVTLLCAELEGVDIPGLVRQFRDAGVAGVHLRTRLACAEDEAVALLKSGVDVISVDVVAGTRETALALTGVDRFERVMGNLDAMLSRRGEGVPWIVPRIERRDAVYAEIERVYDVSVMRFGACVIDALERPIAGERIGPLPVPEGVLRRRAMGEVRVGADGGVRSFEGEALGSLAITPLRTMWTEYAESAWRGAVGLAS
jgi:hypothetical protein